MLFLVVGTPWKRPRSAAFAAPTAVMAGSAAYPLSEWQRYECDCEILVGANRAPPRLPLRNVHASSVTHGNKYWARSLRVAVVVSVFIIVILFAVAFVFLFVFFLVWL